MIAIIDYGVGNLFSLYSSLKFIGAEAVITSSPEEIKKADKIILPGLGLLPGKVVPIEGYIPANLKIPHIGWNRLIFKQKNKLFRYISEGDCVYFVHSYYAASCDKYVIASAEYGKELTAAVAKENIMGCQFHPEKSGEVGLNILRAFCDIKGS